MYDGILAETDQRSPVTTATTSPRTSPGRSGPARTPGVVVIHHMPGYDPPTKEITRTFATQGYVAICPNLHHRYAPAPTRSDGRGRDPRSRRRARRPVHRRRRAAAIEYLRTLPDSNGKVGVIGYCSGGRQAYIVACNLPFDAAVDCYGGRVVAAPEELTERQPVVADRHDAEPLVPAARPVRRRGPQPVTGDGGARSKKR